MSRRAAVLLILTATIGCADAGRSQNLLLGKSPASVQGVSEPARLTDGLLSREGDRWNGDRTALLASTQAFVTYDLGAETTITAAYLQGDHNDRYVVAGSLDGRSFSTIWEAGPIEATGLRERHGADLGGRARFVRLSAAVGDRAFGVSELALYATSPSAWPRPPASAASRLRSAVLLFGLAGALFLLLGCHGAGWRLVVGTTLVAAATVALVVARLAPDAVDGRSVGLLRATLAAVALAAVARPLLPLGRATLRPRCIDGLLGLLALGSVACHFNLGRPQFWDAHRDRASFIHNLDMRVYFPVAKYFHELGFDGVYLASVAAYVDDLPGESVASLGDVAIRDLRTHELLRVREVEDGIEAVRHRFTQERWQEFRRDMTYFRLTMGPRSYLDTLTDHGGNATPVWLMVANLVFRWTSASNATLGATALLDPLLLLLFAIVAARTFGLRSALVCLVVYGANDFTMFGTNWAGSTLRQDWMVALGLGVCALRAGRPRTGGALLGYAGVVRAFPALAVMALCVPPLWWLVDRRRATAVWPDGKALLAAHGSAAQALLGAGVCVGATLALSSVMFGPAAWIAWLHKAAVLSRDFHINHLSLRTLTSFDFGAFDVVVDWHTHPARIGLFVVGVIVFTGLAVLACRRRPPEGAALVGLLLIPIVFYPANYYFHFVFLLPLLASGDGASRDGASSADVWIWAVLLAMCAVEYLAVVADTTRGHFLVETVILLAGFLALLVPLAIHRRFVDVSLVDAGG